MFFFAQLQLLKISETEQLNQMLGKQWIRLCSESELHLTSTLMGGQSFTWTRLSDSLFAKVFFSDVSKTNGLVKVQRHEGCIYATPATSLPLLFKYFRLETDLEGIFPASL
jgi:hypothetical protein